jgi:hypothetical protein
MRVAAGNLAILALCTVVPAEAAFRCKDEKGLTHVGDTPPPACANVVMYEVSKSGSVIRRIEPSLTAEQVKARQEEAARQVEAEKAAAEQRRKDVALLSTYGSEKDIDTARDVNLKPIEGRIKSAQERAAAAEKRQKELEEEMEFYTAGKSKSSKSRTAPPQLVADIEHLKSEKVTLARSIAGYEAEMRQVRERFETDRKRWLELKQMQRDGKLDLRDPKEIEASRRIDPSKTPPKAGASTPR